MAQYKEFRVLLVPETKGKLHHFPASAEAQAHCFAQERLSEGAKTAAIEGLKEDGTWKEVAFYSSV